MSSDQSALVGDRLPPPGLWRRLACLSYEAVLVFGVVMIAAYLYSSLTQQRHALHGKHGLQAFLFVVLGIYFGWFWSRGGQTLAMKTWHLRLVRSDGSALTQRRALMRYLFSWLWAMPALLIAYAWGLSTGTAILSTLTVGVLVYAGLARVRHDRQFWHDAICDTQLITWHPLTRPTAKSQ